MATSTSQAPLAATLGRLAALDAWFAGDVGRPVDEDWHRLDPDTLSGVMPGWVDELAARHGGHRDVAGSYLGGWLGGAAAALPAAALVVERRLPDLAGPIWVRRNDEGWFDRVTYEAPGIVLLPDDPDAGHPDAEVVPDEAALAAHLAGRLAEILAPLLEQVRALAPFGRRGLWGSVADEVASMGLWAGRLAGCDPAATWRTTAQVTDRLAELVPWLRSKPSPCRVTWSGGEDIFTVKGTCCLYFKAQPTAPGDDKAYCTGCPLRTEEDRRARLVAHLESSTA